jgi:hypothetical protein
MQMQGRPPLYRIEALYSIGPSIALSLYLGPGPPDSPPTQPCMQGGAGAWAQGGNVCGELI